jgi:hypothetical protein
MVPKLTFVAGSEKEEPSFCAAEFKGVHTASGKLTFMTHKSARQESVEAVARKVRTPAAKSGTATRHPQITRLARVIGLGARMGSSSVD